MTFVIAAIITDALLAAIPWGIAQAVILWQPKLQERRHRKNYRLITAAIAFLGAALIPTPIGPALWTAAIIAAVVIDVQWFRFARTTNGKNQLADAKAARARVQA